MHYAPWYAVLGETLMISGIACGIGVAWLYLRLLRSFMSSASISAMTFFIAAGATVGARSVVRLLTLDDPAHSIMLALCSAVFFLLILAAAESTRRAAIEEHRVRTVLQRVVKEGTGHGELR